jgi:hypothetical protein
MRKWAKPLYRIAAVLFVLFAAGHTAGFLSFRPVAADALAVMEGMNRVRFDMGGAEATFMGFYRGFGLFVSAYLLFAAFLSWVLGNATGGEVAVARNLAWGLFVVQLVNIALCLHYFGPVQAIFAVACAAAVGGAAAQTRCHPSLNTRAKMASM